MDVHVRRLRRATAGEGEGEVDRARTARAAGYAPDAEPVWGVVAGFEPGLRVRGAVVHV